MRDEWKKRLINVGVTGNSGVGKSSFINALRGLTSDDEGGAAVGATETTMEPTQYKYPDNENMLLWDLPGVNTPTFPKDKYLEEIKVARYDYFIVLSASRFTDIDRWLAEQLQKMNKKFYFVRTKIGSDVADDKRSHPKTHDVQKLLDKIRDDCLKQLDYTGDMDTVYLIDNFETEKYDFNTLCCALVDDASELIKEAMLFTLTCFAEEIILAKNSALKERIFGIAAICGALGALPIQGLDIAVDLAALVEEVNFYKQQFGLSDDLLEQHGGRLKLDTCCLEFTKQGMIAYMMSSLGTKKLVQYGAEKILKYLFPGLGNIVSGVASYSGCAFILNSILDMCFEDALKISRFMSDLRGALKKYEDK